ncbi:poly-gamma-glutamate biosynthesis protein PgsC/CapC [Halolamina sediminis]|uniref:poly-gamma-glutamate biosynthesis protein PgsC/CapC n=1 Tax=Halolamina sediminis TaxID=1480675 RepID=UPI0009ACD722|nr:poly-gamma-glutamate biosynthesis protein PgsC/CapC [Halolamina sediminis]
MIVAVTVTAFGLLAVAGLTQVYGYRLGGTIAIPVLAVYTLKNFVMLPIYALSAALAYIGLRLLKDRTLIYGRDELLAAILIGSLVPVTILLTLGVMVENVFQTVVFVGSILPGLAAYNYHQLDPETRRWDLVTACVLFVCLFGLGWYLVSAEFAPVLATGTPPTLYSRTADVATWKGIAVSDRLSPVILPRLVTVLLFAIGMLLSERVRERYDVRIGVVSVALLGIYSLADRRLVYLYVCLLILSYVAIQAVHYSTLLYGRVLVGLGAAFGIVAAVPLSIEFEISRGLSAYFVGILAGVNAYNAHVTQPSSRWQFVPLQFGAFVLLLCLARITGAVLPRGFPRQFGAPEAIVGVTIVAICFAIVERTAHLKPDEAAINDRSILNVSESTDGAESGAHSHRRETNS